MRETNSPTSSNSSGRSGISSKKQPPTPDSTCGSSQINGCAYCLDLHTRDARRLGEDDRRLHLVAAWWETDLYSPQERAALALTETISKLSQTQDVPDDLYAQATEVFTKEQYTAVVWSISVINTFNRLAVTSRKALPARVA
jgi:AhpD family alkylhydroperoxidase